jgi:hypothetical protein
MNSPATNPKAGAPAGASMEEMGAKAGSLNDSQEYSSNRQDSLQHQEEEGVLIGDDGASSAPEGMYQWTILDSNQRPPRCQRGALTN